MNYPKCHGEIAVSAGQMAKNIKKKAWFDLLLWLNIILFSNICHHTPWCSIEIFTDGSDAEFDDAFKGWQGSN